MLGKTIYDWRGKGETWMGRIGGSNSIVCPVGTEVI